MSHDDPKEVEERTEQQTMAMTADVQVPVTLRSLLRGSVETTVYIEAEEIEDVRVDWGHIVGSGDDDESDPG